MPTHSLRPVPVSLAALASLCLACVATAQTVTVGPAGSGAMYENIQDGIDAAPPGGVVLVAPGSYAAQTTLTIDKPLTLLGAGRASTSYVALIGSATTSRLPLLVTGVPAGGRVVVSGMTLYSEFSFLISSPQAFVVRDCDGPVVLVDLEAGGGASPNPVDATGVVRDSASVTIDKCELGATAGGAQLPLVPALLVEGSLVHVNACQLRGQNSSATLVSDGAPGIVAIDSTVRIARSDVRGAIGSHQSGFFLPMVATSGGAAIQAIGSNVLVRGGQGNLLRGGTGGIGSLNGVSLVGPGGPALYLDAASIGSMTPDVDAAAGLNGNLVASTPTVDGPGLFAALAFPLATMVISVPLVAPGGVAAFSLTGEPGAVCLPLFALSQGAGFVLPGVLGLFTLDPAGIVTSSVVTISGVGGGVAFLPVPGLPSLVGTVVHAQVLSFGPSGSVSVAGPTSFAVR